MFRPSNLALRPFRNERVPWLLAMLLLLGSLATSIFHGRFVGRLLSGAEAKTVQLVRDDEARTAELEALVANQPPTRLETAELTRLRAIKELVDRRVFPWRRLLTVMEDLLPDDVRLVRITPTVLKDASGMKVELGGDARTKDAAFSFAEALESSPAFSEVVLKSLVEEGREVAFAVEAVVDAALLETGSRRPGVEGLPMPTPATVNPPRNSR